MNLSSLAPADVLSALNTISVLLAKETLRSWKMRRGRKTIRTLCEEDKNVIKKRNATLLSLFMETRRAVMKFAKTHPNTLRNFLLRSITFKFVVVFYLAPCECARNFFFFYKFTIISK